MMLKSERYFMQTVLCISGWIECCHAVDCVSWQRIYHCDLTDNIDINNYGMALWQQKLKCYQN